MSTQTQADSTISYPDDDNVIATASSTGDNTTTNEVELDDVNVVPRELSAYLPLIEFLLRSSFPSERKLRLNFLRSHLRKDAQIKPSLKNRFKLCLDRIYKNLLMNDLLPRKCKITARVNSPSRDMKPDSTGIHEEFILNSEIKDSESVGDGSDYNHHLDSDNAIIKTNHSDSGKQNGIGDGAILRNLEIISLHCNHSNDDDDDNVENETLCCNSDLKFQKSRIKLNRMLGLESIRNPKRNFTSNINEQNKDQNGTTTAQLCCSRTNESGTVKNGLEIVEIGELIKNILDDCSKNKNNEECLEKKNATETEETRNSVVAAPSIPVIIGGVVRESSPSNNFNKENIVNIKTRTDPGDKFLAPKIPIIIGRTVQKTVKTNTFSRTFTEVTIDDESYCSIEKTAQNKVKENEGHSTKAASKQKKIVADENFGESQIPVITGRTVQKPVNANSFTENATDKKYLMEKRTQNKMNERGDISTRATPNQKKTVVDEELLPPEARIYMTTERSVKKTVNTNNILSATDAAGITIDKSYRSVDEGAQEKPNEKFDMFEDIAKQKTTDKIGEDNGLSSIPVITNRIAAQNCAVVDDNCISFCEQQQSPLQHTLPNSSDRLNITHHSPQDTLPDSSDAPCLNITHSPYLPLLPYPNYIPVPVAAGIYNMLPVIGTVLQTHITATSINIGDSVSLLDAASFESISNIEKGLGEDHMEVVKAALQHAAVVSQNKNSPHSYSPRDPRLDHPRDPRSDQSRDPRLDHTKDPRLDHPKDPRLDHPKDPRLDQLKDPRLDHPRDPRLDPQRDPRLDHSRDPRLDNIKDTQQKKPIKPTENRIPPAAISSLKDGTIMDLKTSHFMKNSIHVETMTSSKLASRDPRLRLNVGKTITAPTNNLKSPVNVARFNDEKTAGPSWNIITPMIQSAHYSPANVILPISKDTDVMLPISNNGSSRFPDEDNNRYSSANVILPISKDTDVMLPISNNGSSRFPDEDNHYSSANVILPISKDTDVMLPISNNGSRRFPDEDNRFHKIQSYNKEYNDNGSPIDHLSECRDNYSNNNNNNNNDNYYSEESRYHSERGDVSAEETYYDPDCWRYEGRSTFRNEEPHHNRSHRYDDDSSGYYSRSSLSKNIDRRQSNFQEEGKRSSIGKRNYESDPRPYIVAAENTESVQRKTNVRPLMDINRPKDRNFEYIKNPSFKPDDNRSKHLDNRKSISSLGKKSSDIRKNTTNGSSGSRSGDINDRLKKQKYYSDHREKSTTVKADKVKTSVINNVVPSSSSTSHNNNNNKEKNIDGKLEQHGRNLVSPLENLFKKSEKTKVGHGYGIQKLQQFRIPKIQREDSKSVDRRITVVSPVYKHQKTDEKSSDRQNVVGNKDKHRDDKKNDQKEKIIGDKKERIDDQKEKTIGDKKERIDDQKEKIDNQNGKIDNDCNERSNGTTTEEKSWKKTRRSHRKGRSHRKFNVGDNFNSERNSAEDATNKDCIPDDKSVKAGIHKLAFAAANKNETEQIEITVDSTTKSIVSREMNGVCNTDVDVDNNLLQPSDKIEDVTSLSQIVPTGTTKISDNNDDNYDNTIKTDQPSGELINITTEKPTNTVFSDNNNTVDSGMNQKLLEDISTEVSSSSDDKIVKCNNNNNSNNTSDELQTDGGVSKNATHDDCNKSIKSMENDKCDNKELEIKDDEASANNLSNINEENICDTKKNEHCKTFNNNSITDTSSSSSLLLQSSVTENVRNNSSSDCTDVFNPSKIIETFLKGSSSASSASSSSAVETNSVNADNSLNPSKIMEALFKGEFQNLANSTEAMSALAAVGLAVLRQFQNVPSFDMINTINASRSNAADDDSGRNSNDAGNNNNNSATNSTGGKTEILSIVDDNSKVETLQVESSQSSTMDAGGKDAEILPTAPPIVNENSCEVNQSPPVESMQSQTIESMQSQTIESMQSQTIENKKKSTNKRRSKRNITTKVKTTQRPINNSDEQKETAPVTKEDTPKNDNNDNNNNNDNNIPLNRPVRARRCVSELDRLHQDINEMSRSRNNILTVSSVRSCRLNNPISYTESVKRTTTASSSSSTTVAGGRKTTNAMSTFKKRSIPSYMDSSSDSSESDDEQSAVVNFSSNTDTEADGTSSSNHQNGVGRQRQRLLLNSDEKNKSDNNDKTCAESTSEVMTTTLKKNDLRSSDKSTKSHRRLELNDDNSNHNNNDDGMYKTNSDGEKCTNANEPINDDNSDNKNFDSRGENEINKHKQLLSAANKDDQGEAVSFKCKENQNQAKSLRPSSGSNEETETIRSDYGKSENQISSQSDCGQSENPVTKSSCSNKCQSITTESDVIEISNKDEENHNTTVRVENTDKLNDAIEISSKAEENHNTTVRVENTDKLNDAIEISNKAEENHNTTVRVENTNKFLNDAIEISDEAKKNENIRVENVDKFNDVIEVSDGNKNIVRVENADRLNDVIANDADEKNVAEDANADVNKACPRQFKENYEETDVSAEEESDVSSEKGSDVSVEEESDVSSEKESDVPSEEEPMKIVIMKKMMNDCVLDDNPATVDASGNVGAPSDNISGSNNSCTSDNNNSSSSNSTSQIAMIASIEPTSSDRTNTTESDHLAVGTVKVSTDTANTSSDKVENIHSLLNDDQPQCRHSNSDGDNNNDGDGMMPSSDMLKQEARSYLIEYEKEECANDGHTDRTIYKSSEDCANKLTDSSSVKDSTDNSVGNSIDSSVKSSIDNSSVIISSVRSVKGSIKHSAIISVDNMVTTRSVDDSSIRNSAIISVDKTVTTRSVDSSVDSSATKTSIITDEALNFQLLSILVRNDEFDYKCNAIDKCNFQTNDFKQIVSHMSVSHRNLIWKGFCTVCAQTSSRPAHSADVTSLLHHIMSYHLPLMLKNSSHDTKNSTDSEKPDSSTVITLDEEETKTSDENRTKEENGDGKKNEVKSEAAPKTTPKIWVRRFSNDNTFGCDNLMSAATTTNDPKPSINNVASMSGSELYKLMIPYSDPVNGPRNYVSGQVQRDDVHFTPVTLRNSNSTRRHPQNVIAPSTSGSNNLTLMLNDQSSMIQNRVVEQPSSRTKNNPPPQLLRVNSSSTIAGSSQIQMPQLNSRSDAVECMSNDFTQLPARLSANRQLTITSITKQPPPYDASSSVKHPQQRQDNPPPYQQAGNVMTAVRSHFSNAQASTINNAYQPQPPVLSTSSSSSSLPLKPIIYIHPSDAGTTRQPAHIIAHGSMQFVSGTKTLPSTLDSYSGQQQHQAHQQPPQAHQQQPQAHQQLYQAHQQSHQTYQQPHQAHQQPHQAHQQPHQAHQQPHRAHQQPLDRHVTTNVPKQLHQFPIQINSNPSSTQQQSEMYNLLTTTTRKPVTSNLSTEASTAKSEQKTNSVGPPEKSSVTQYGNPIVANEPAAETAVSHNSANPPLSKKLGAKRKLDDNANSPEVKTTCKKKHTKRIRSIDDDRSSAVGNNLRRRSNNGVIEIDSSSSGDESAELCSLRKKKLRVKQELPSETVPLELPPPSAVMITDKSIQSKNKVDIEVIKSVVVEPPAVTCGSIPNSTFSSSSSTKDVHSRQENNGGQIVATKAVEDNSSNSAAGRCNSAKKLKKKSAQKFIKKSSNPQPLNDNNNNNNNSDKVSPSNIVSSSDVALCESGKSIRYLIHILKCAVSACNFSTTTKDEFVCHINEHGKNDVSKTTANVHNKEYMKCVYCQVSQETPQSLWSHIMKSHGNCNFQCRYCDFRSCRPSYVGWHQAMEHPKERVNVLVPENVPFDIQFKSQKVPHSIFSCFVLPYDCSRCKMQYITAKSFQTHLLEKHKRYRNFKCPTCNAQLFTETYVTHMREHSICTYQCVYCVYGTEDEGKIREHLTENHFSSFPMAVYRTNPSTTILFQSMKEYLVIEDRVTNESVILMNLDTDIDVRDRTCKVNVDGIVICSSFETTAGNNNNVSDSPVIVEDSFSESDAAASRLIIDDESDTTATVTGSSSSSNTVEIENAVSSLLSSYETVDTSSIDVSNRSSSDHDMTVVITDDEHAANVETPAVVFTKGSGDNVIKFDSRGIEYGRSDCDGLTGRALYRCGIATCSFSGETSFDLHNHIVSCPKSISSTIITCPHCDGNKFGHGAKYLTHLRVHGIARFICSLCSFRSSLQNLMINHMKQRHSSHQNIVKPIDPSKKNINYDFFVCVPDASKGSTNLDGSRKRRKTLGNPRIVHSSVEAESALHNAVYRDEIVCGICGTYSSKTRNHILGHVKNCESTTSHSSDGTPTSSDANYIPLYVPINVRYRCIAGDCNYISLKLEMLMNHYKALHKDVKIFSCPHCHPSVKSSKKIPLDQFPSHLMLHDETLYKCPNCLFCHHSRKNMMRHIKSNHPSKRQDFLVIRGDSQDSSTVISDDGSSSECETEVFVGRGNNSRCNVKRFRCCLCTFETVSNESIQNHCGINHHCTSKLFKCCFCSFVSDLENVLSEHYALYHAKLIKDYVRIYTVIMPVAKQSLIKSPKSKRKRFRSPLRAALPPGDNATKEERIKSYGRPSLKGTPCYQCPKCGAQSVQEERFVTHMYREYNYNKWACKECGKLGLNRSILVEHARTQHLKINVITTLDEDASFEKWVADMARYQSEIIRRHLNGIPESDSDDDVVLVSEPSTILDTIDISHDDEERSVVCERSIVCESEAKILSEDSLNEDNNLPPEPTLNECEEMLCPACAYTDRQYSSMKLHIRTEHVDMAELFGLANMLMKIKVVKVIITPPDSSNEQQQQQGEPPAREQPEIDNHLEMTCSNQHRISLDNMLSEIFDGQIGRDIVVIDNSEQRSSSDTSSDASRKRRLSMSHDVDSAKSEGESSLNFAAKRKRTNSF